MKTQKTKPDLAELAGKLKAEAPEFAFTLQKEKRSTEEACLVAWGCVAGAPGDPASTRAWLYDTYADEGGYLLATLGPDGLTVRALSLVEGLGAMGQIGAGWARAAAAAE